MKNILVPTDFTVQSLQLVHEIVRRNPQQKLSIHLVHLVQIPTDITELLFVKKSRLHDQVPYKFSQAMDMLKNKYSSCIAWMGLEFYYGSTATALNNIIENRKIHEVFVFADQAYGKPLKGSVNVISLLNRCRVPVCSIQPRVGAGVPGEAQLFSSLFVEEQPMQKISKLLQKA